MVATAVGSAAMTTQQSPVGAAVAAAVVVVTVGVAAVAGVAVAAVAAVAAMAVVAAVVVVVVVATVVTLSLSVCCQWLAVFERTLVDVDVAVIGVYKATDVHSELLSH